MDPITLVVTGTFAAIAVAIFLIYRLLQNLTGFVKSFNPVELFAAYEKDRQERDQAAQAEAKKLSDLPMEAWTKTLDPAAGPTKDQQIRWYIIQIADLERRNKMLERENQRLRMVAQENRQVETDVVEVEAS